MLENYVVKHKKQAFMSFLLKKRLISHCVMGNITHLVHQENNHKGFEPQLSIRQRICANKG